ncbi:hypothetical protein CKM354_001236800 [Cercospora kikuchii]|uniref:Uncharacterized protein n=1 Tax=Cercospora kikuchii TaxID=84275 RepID=A0A9P3FLV1_9PEZI|nr:uncharacterized protein CKM354_001236800 [Cercospora kikuchii]GIZ49336.1 hypothetical protein CKM354_001236800 [Cercospora kikuchii]
MNLFTFKATHNATTPADIRDDNCCGLVANLSGLLNLNDPKAVQAGLKNRKEPIKIYAMSFIIPREASSRWSLVSRGVSSMSRPVSELVGRCETTP